MNFTGSLNRFIESHGLFTRQSKLLVTVSGGIDSIVLLHCLHYAGYNISIAHCNFQLRGEESDDDELFVEQYAKSLGLPFFFTRFDTNQSVNDGGESVQMVARNLRYSWFENIRSQNNYDFILTAHHQNDLLETILLNLVRGTGLAGFHGIQPSNGFIIRPLLFASKEDIEIYAKEHNLQWREDSSNKSDKYKRNLLRNKVIPYLKEINPSLEKTTLHTAELVNLSEHFIQTQFEKIKSQILKIEDGYFKINIKTLTQFQDSLFILTEVLRGFNFNYLTAKQILVSDKAISGKLFLSATHRLLKDRDFWIIDSLQSSEIIPITITAGQTELKVSDENFFVINVQDGGLKNLEFIKDRKMLVLDFDTLKFPITLRKWASGDVFEPLGLNGSKKISDLLTDLKLNLFQKEKQMLIECDGKIAAVLNTFPSRSFSVTEKTKRLFVMRLKEVNSRSY